MSATQDPTGNHPIAKGRLSAPHTKKGRTQRVVLDLLTEQADGVPDFQTSSTFVFYELEQQGLATKPSPDDTRVNRRRNVGWPPGRQDIIDAVKHLRDTGHVPWSWIVDESRTLDDWAYAATVPERLAEMVAGARIDAWDGDPPPLILCESRATAGVLRELTRHYLCPITGLGGHAGGFLITEVAPLFEGEYGAGRLVLYLGDLDFSGNHIEDNAKRVLGRALGRDVAWMRLGMTETLARAGGIEPIMKTDGRTRKTYPAIEVESLGRAAVLRLVRHILDELLPKPLDRVLEREQTEQEAAATKLGEWGRSA